MKHLFRDRFIIFMLLLWTVPGFGQDNLWEKDFVMALQKGKAESITKVNGLGYTMSETEILKKAIKNALDQDAPPCDAMKIAIDLKYKPYEVIKNIFSQYHLIYFQ